MKKTILKSIRIILGGILMLSLFGCSVNKYEIDYCGAKSSYQGAKSSYESGEEVELYYKNIVPEDQGNGVVRRVLAYSDDVMCVENRFAKGAVGALHHHPHTQITYVVSGQFEFEIDGVKKIVNPGDTMLKKDGVIHGCVCLKEGILLDIFTPMRKDFVK